MLTLLLYVLIVGLVAAVLFLLASAVFGRGEELGPLPDGTTATVLPAAGITGADVRSLRFQQVVRGYKAGEVDWALARLAARIDELQAELAHARGYSAPAGANHHGPQPPFDGPVPQPPADVPSVPAAAPPPVPADGEPQSTGWGYPAEPRRIQSPDNQ
ncbi:DivIVA domain-containing protein [Nocardia sp. NPDC048505]|uniref:DivIVA domain-containing protein n=1 Tax=unclassified Nocardia TaxID=2637762 RepID=UPI0033DDF013